MAGFAPPPKRCTFCGAKIVSGACHCGAAGRMREPHDAADAVAAYEEMHPDLVRHYTEPESE